MPGQRTFRAGTYYTLGLCRLGPHGWSTQSRVCCSCGQDWMLHAEDTRCYTLLEREAALRFFRQHRRWPATLFRPPEETPHA